MHLVVPAVLAISGCSADTHGQESPPAQDTDRPLEKSQRAASNDAQRANAARSGLRWILDHSDALPQGWSFHILNHLYRVLEDEQAAARIRTILVEDDAAGRYLHLPETLHDPRTMHQAVLGTVLMELMRRKEIGRPYEQYRNELQAQIATQEAGLWPTVSPTRRLIILYIFGELGIHSTLTVESVIRDLRMLGERRDPAALPTDRVYMLALTHVVFNRSRYFVEYVDAKEFEFVVGPLRRALRYYLDSPPDDYFLDIQAEILQCWQLLRLPEDELTAAAYTAVIGRQNADGTWGAAGLNHERKAHLTYSAVLALLEYPQEFRRLGPFRRP